MLWPNVKWVVNSSGEGLAWGLEFQNQAEPLPAGPSPDLVRPGVCTRRELAQIASADRYVDGWEHVVTVQFTFNSAIYEGDFVYGLLQSWRRVD